MTDGGFRCILADPPWRFNSLWGGRPKKVGGNYPSRAIDSHYDTLSMQEIKDLPVASVAATDCVLFLWCCWPTIKSAFDVIDAWGFTYKTCAFSWMKAHPKAEETVPFMGLGYWTRANTEPCLLATRGKPKRVGTDVRQGIIAPRREHSRKPDEIHGRIERLVDGPRLEMFSRQVRQGWTAWGNEAGKFDGSPKDYKQRRPRLVSSVASDATMGGE